MVPMWGIEFLFFGLDASFSGSCVGGLGSGVFKNRILALERMSMKVYWYSLLPVGVRVCVGQVLHGLSAPSQALCKPPLNRYPQ